MKIGYFVGYTEDNDEGRIVYADKEEMMLEEFMKEFGIRDPQNVVGPFPSPEGARRMRDTLVHLAIRRLHGSDDPKVVAAARNTGLFGLKGPAIGDIGGKLDITLMEFVAQLAGR